MKYLQNSPHIFGKSCDVFGEDLPGLSKQFHSYFRPGSDTYCLRIRNPIGNCPGDG